MPGRGDGEVFLKTDRLIVRHWQDGDIDTLSRVLSDYPGEELPPEDAWAVSQVRDHIEWKSNNPFPAPGCFQLPLVISQSGRPIGMVALNLFDKEKNIPEIEWDIGPEFWDKGYATEIGKEMIRYAFGRAGFLKIAGFTRPDNGASSRVMEKLGMKFTGMEIYKNGLYRFYIIEK